jgi:membrane-associated phospholipid phosphatase
MSVASVGSRLRGYGHRLAACSRRLLAYGRSLAERVSAGDRWALLQLSGLSAVGFLAVYGIFVATPPGQWVDVQVFGLAQKATEGPLTSWLPALGRRVLPPSLAAAGVLLSLAALVRRRWREVGFSALTVSVSTALAPVLRLRALERPDYGGWGYAHNTLPSTHMAAACSLLVAAVVLWTPPRSPWIFGTAFLLGVLAALGNVVGYAHLPSDVLASVFVVGAVATLAGAVCGLPRARPQPRSRVTEGHRR